MAIYHLCAKIHSRDSGKSIVAAAAYRAGQSLVEEQTGITHDYTRKAGVDHSEILAPEGAPQWVYDRLSLWNAVEAVEKRRDAQLAREVEVGLPIELGDDQQLSLVREFARREFVSRGMIADFSIHRDDANNPHAHILLSLRRISNSGWGLKERSWNAREHLMRWREGWEEVSNEHLARAGLAVRIDHRTLKAQGLDLQPGRKIGVGRQRQKSGELPHRIADRIEEQRDIARENGRKIIEDPAVALRGLTHGQATFSKRDLAKYLHTRTQGAEQFEAAMLKVTASSELVSLGLDDRRQERFTSREMIDTEAELLRRTERMTARFGHGVAKSHQISVLSQHGLSAEQRVAFEHLIDAGDLKALVGVAGSGKCKLLAAAREAWEAEGLSVKGAALSGIAAENLSLASGIASRTLASFEHAWKADRESLTHKDVLVIDEAGMVGTRQLARILQAAHDARAKVVLVGDPEQLQAIEAGAPFRAVLTHSGMVQLNEVRRQHHAWQRQATRQLAIGETAQALVAYEEQGALIQVASHEAARTALLARWAKEGETKPKATRLMLAYTREDVRELNELARTLRQQRKELGREEVIQTERGMKAFAVNDRLCFLRNEKSLGVKNGSLGTIEAVQDGILQVKLDNQDELLAIDTRFYKDLDYGYAATVYKAQGSTVDRAYLLATAHYDRHAAYVALSRHREAAAVFYAAEDFGADPANEFDRQRIRERFLSALSRARPKELVHDYLDRQALRQESGERKPGDVGSPAPANDQRSAEEMKSRPRNAMDELEWRQQQAAERWREKERARERGLDREGELNQGRQAPQPELGEPGSNALKKEKDRSRRGPEDEFGL